MPKPTKKSPLVTPRSAGAPEIVDPRWLLRMLGLLVLVALVCGYLTLGLLFYMGSWQLALKPTHDAGKGLGFPAQVVEFGSFQGEPKIKGQWVVAGESSQTDGFTALYLRAADGQLDAGDGTQIAMLRDHGLNVLAFDYRGYGPDHASHPTEQRMLQDAGAAWDYLTKEKKIAPDHLLVFGSGVGVSLGAQLLAAQHGGAALIGYNADPDVLARVERDPRSRLFPMRLVFHERFSLEALHTLTTPKLLYSTGPLDQHRREVYQGAADPKMTFEVSTHDARQEELALSRFLDQYLARAPQTLLPAK
ncbi:MAG: alpha/beta hydrolase [Janthinobacterium lividum]